MPDARLYAWQGAKAMPNARPARSGLAKTSRRWANLASGGVRRSCPLAQKALEQVLSQTEGVISFRYGMLRARCRQADGNLPTEVAVLWTLSVVLAATHADRAGQSWRRQLCRPHGSATWVTMRLSGRRM